MHCPNCNKNTVHKKLKGNGLDFWDLFKTLITFGLWLIVVFIKLFTFDNKAVCQICGKNASKEGKIFEYIFTIIILIAIIYWILS